MPLSQSLSSSLAAPPGTGSCSKVSPQPSPLQADQPQLSQPFLPAERFQLSDHCWGLLWPHSNRSMFFLCYTINVTDVSSSVFVIPQPPPLSIFPVLIPSILLYRSCSMLNYTALSKKRNTTSHFIIKKLLVSQIYLWY